MAVKMMNKEKTSSKVKAPTKSEAPTELQLLVDQLGELEEEVAALKAMPVFKKYDEVLQKLRELADSTLNPSEAGVLTGLLYSASVTAKKVSSSLPAENVPAAKEHIGDAWESIAIPSITDLRKYLPKPVADKLIRSEHTGARTVKVSKQK